MNKQEKPILICLFGFMAVGKLTIAEKLFDKTKTNLSHNHLLNDYITSMFPRGNKTRHELMEKYKIETLGRMVKDGLSVITTEAYASNFTSLNGTTSKELIEKIEKAIVNNGGIFYGVHLIADEKTILERVPNESRLKYMKLMDPTETRKLLTEAGEQNPPEIKNLLTIDTRKNSPEESVQKILEFINKKIA